jgi:dihydroneopterin aldolase
MKEPSNLLEHVCKRISDSIYQAFAQVQGIEITLCKDTPPMGGDRLKAAVTIKSVR